MATFTFEGLVDELRTQFDVTQTRAVEVVNHRLQEILARAEALEYRKSLGTTTSGTSTYTLAASIISLGRVRADYSTGTVLYEAIDSRQLDEVDAGLRTLDPDVTVFALLHDTDDDATTASLRIYPTPSESSVTLLGIYAGLPSELTYSSGTALPLNVDFHEALLAGCRAEFYAREEERPDLAATEEAKFAAGIDGLRKRKNARTEGDAPLRAQMWMFDF